MAGHKEPHCLILAAALIAASLLAFQPATAQEIKKTVDRRFPVFQYCPIDPALTLVFTATGPEAILKFTTANFDGESWNAQALDNIAVVPQSVFQASQVVTPGYESCYVSPGTENTPGYDFLGGGPEAFLDLLDSDANLWDLGSYGYYNNFNGAPRDPQTGLDTSGGALGLGQTADGPVTVSVSTRITGLVQGESYVVTGWWYTQNLAPLDISVDFNVPVTLGVPGVAFAPQTPGLDGVSNSTGVLTGQGTYVAPLALRHGATLLELTLVTNVTDPLSSVTGRIYRVDNRVSGPPNPQVIAGVNWTGSTFSNVATVSTPITSVLIDVTRYDHYLAVEQDSGVETYGLRVLYKEPAPAPSSTVGVAAIAFDGETSSADLKTGQNGTLVNSGTGTGRYVAPIRFPHAATLALLRLTVLDNAPGDVTARLIRVPANAVGGSVLTAVSSSGASPSVRQFTNSSIVDPDIDNSAAYYYLEIEAPPGVPIYGVQVEYGDPPEFPRFPADNLAAVPFLPEDSAFDRRAPVSNALAGQFRFDMGLRLPDQHQVMIFWMSVRDNSPDGEVNAYLYRLDTTTVSVGPQLMARLESQGAVDSERLFFTDTIIGRTIDNTRYFYYVQLYTGLEPVQINGLIVEYKPCGDEDGDGYNGCVDDCNDNRPAVHPGAPEVCDGVLNDCSAPFWPDVSGTTEGDDDFDGFSECQGDCADFDPNLWSPPGEVRNLQLAHGPGTGVTTLTWAAPQNPGGTAAPLYDALRTSDPTNFLSGGAACIESNGVDTTATLTLAPLPGQVLFVLVRAEATCGAGPLGFRSDGTEIGGRSCP